MQIFENDGVPTTGIVTVVTQANNGPELQRQLQTAIDALGETSDMGFVDVSLSGGGAGNVVCGHLLAQVNAGFVQCEDCTARVYEASDRASLATRIGDGLTALADTTIVAWHTCSAGDGAVFFAVFITTPTPSPG